MKCPRCQAENPSSSKYCAECATPLPTSRVSRVGATETIQTAARELTTGSTFAGRYQVIEELGRGGMGRVYKVYDTKTREKIALKLLKPEISSDADAIERFGNELRLARKVSHRNVCRMYDLGDDRGTHYITMEYVSGEDLKSMIRMSGSLSLGMLLSVGRQAADGLAEAHGLGVVHRDLKPQNIMIDRSGSAKIMDFGIARSVREKGMTGPSVMIGTPEYMSPEQSEAKEVDHRSDIYSLGVILYEMATSRVPFEGETALSVAMKHKGEKPKDPGHLNPGIPADLGGVILKCLEKDKSIRYQSAADLRAELERIEKGLPTTERVVSARKSFTSKEITVKFSLKKLVLPILAAVVVPATALFVWRLIPKQISVSAPKIENSVAVISFENQTGDKSYDYLQKAIPNLLITNLERSGNLYVATWERMRDLLKQLEKDNVESITADLGFELSRVEGIKTVALGTYTKAGEMFVTDVKLLDAETKRLLKSASSRGEGVDSILRTQIDELSGEIVKGIGLAPEREAAGQRAVAEVTTSSMEAYHYYLKGYEEQAQYLYPEALESFKKAVNIDPAFAKAYQGLSAAYENMWETRASHEAMEKAMALSRRATEKERLYIEADYAAYIEQDREKSIRILKELLNKYPKEKYAYGYMADQYGFYESEKAAEVLQRALAVDPNYAMAVNTLGLHYRYQGEFRKALELFNKYASVSPEKADPLDSLANLFFREGKLEDAEAKFKEALSMRPDFVWATLALHYIAALKEDYSEAVRLLDGLISGMSGEANGWFFAGIPKGYLRIWLGSREKAAREFDVILEIADRLGNTEMAALINLVKAWFFYDQGELELSRDSYKKFETYFGHGMPARYYWYVTGNKPRQAFSSFYYGLLELKEGRIPSAKSRLEEMRSFLPKDKIEKDPDYFCLRGEILLAEGKAREAIALLKSAPPKVLISLSYGPTMVVYNLPFLQDALARAYEQAGERDKAIAEYERLTSFRSRTKEPFLVHPKYHYRLARLYEQKGQKEKTAERYRRFLDLWKDADPGLPEVEDAKSRLAGLQGNR
jgi:eukaryotic-like serine/threonine-protein kinase